MARRVMSPIDLRSQAERQGITRNQQTAQAIAGILETMGRAEQKRREGQTLTRITRAIARGSTMPEAVMAAMDQPEFSGGARGMLQKFGGMFQPSPGLMGQNIQQAMIGQAVGTDPLEREYKRAQIGAAKSLTAQREEAAKYALPDRMISRANLQLRIADGAMREYYWAEPGPYRDRLLKQAINAREKAIEITEKYGMESEAGKLLEQEIVDIDKMIKDAGGKVSKPKKVGTITATYSDISTKHAVDRYPRPQTKTEFDNTLKHISSEEGKDRYYDKWWRPGVW